MEEFTALCWRGLPRGAVCPGAKINLVCHLFVSLFPGALVYVNHFHQLLILALLFFLLRIVRNFNRLDYLHRWNLGRNFRFFRF